MTLRELLNMDILVNTIEGITVNLPYDLDFIKCNCYDYEVEFKLQANQLRYLDMKVCNIIVSSDDRAFRIEVVK